MNNIEFNNPEFLWLLILVPLLAIYFYKSKTNRINLFKVSSLILVQDLNLKYIPY